MRALNVSNTAQALGNITPFTPNHTVVALNPTDAAVTLQHSDAQAGTYTTLAAVPAYSAVEVELNERWIRLAAPGSLVLLGN
jgi:hypothetical protein